VALDGAKETFVATGRLDACSKVIDCGGQCAIRESSAIDGTSPHPAVLVFLF
jgi:hypothetical protein